MDKDRPRPVTAPPRGIGVWVAGARPRTLPASVVPVAVGTACAVGVGDHGIIWWRVAAAAIVALALQVATNYANDYSDGIRGTDSVRRAGPVRLVGQRLASPKAVKTAAFAAFGVAGLAGLALAIAVGWQLIVVGVVCMAAGWFYTGGPRPYGYAGLGEAFVFVFFGLVATAGTTYVVTEELTALAIGAAVPVGLLATALLVTNNLRDIPGDTTSGKRTLAVRLGDRFTRALYIALIVGTLVGMVLVAIVGDRPWALLGFVGIVFAMQPIRQVLDGARGPQLVPVLVDTGRFQLVCGLLFAIGIALSG